MSEQQHKRERIAYEELQAGDLIQPGDEWQNLDGRWHPLVLMPESSTQVRDNLRARRPHNITALEKYRGDLIDDIQHVIGERDDARAALKSTQRARDELQRQVDELRTDRDRLQGLIDNLLDEPTARQVRDMLRTWLTELDWSTGCFGSFGRSQIEIIEQTMVVVINRISSMIDPEGDSDDN